MGRQFGHPPVPAYCYPSSFEFECETCGALPKETCVQEYGDLVYVTGGNVHRSRALARGEEVKRRVALFRAEQDNPPSVD